MNSKFLWGIVGVLVIAGIAIYIFISPNLGKHSINLDETQNEVLAAIEENKKYVQETTEFFERNGGEGEIGFFNPSHEEEESHKSDPKEDVIKYFITGLIKNDIDIFLSSFYPDSISKDLFKHENPDKFAVTKEIMKKISRNGEITAIDYKVNKGFMDQETSTITLTITYSDKQRSDITLELMTVEDIHHEGEIHQIYVISNSVWDMINQIELDTL